MIDWLEALLEEKEPLRWGQAHIPQINVAGGGSRESAGEDGWELPVREEERVPEAGAEGLRRAVEAGGLRRAFRPGSEVPIPEGRASSVSQTEEGQELYRRLMKAGRIREQARVAPRSDPGERQSAGAPSLTADELDRAVRRDSRRYDGAMELY